MKLDEIIIKLMDMDEDTNPCELDIPCSYRDETLEDRYCDCGNCYQGMTELLTKRVREENNNVD